MKLTLFFIILTIDFDSIKQLIDLTRDDPTVYAIITALPDVIALLIYADIMSAIKNNFEHVAKGTTNILHRKSSSILFVETLIQNYKRKSSNRCSFDNIYKQNNIIQNLRDYHIHLEIFYLDIMTIMIIHNRKSKKRKSQ